MKLNKLLRQKRLEKGLTQNDLAILLGYNDGQFVSNWERNYCSPPLHKAKRIAKLLDVPLDQYKQLLVSDYKSSIEEWF